MNYLAFLTFLSPAAGQPARKAHRLIQSAAGPRLETIGYAHAARFTHVVEEFADIEGLADVLQRQAQRNSFAIRGAVREGAPPIIRRRCKGDDAPISDAGSRVIAVDLDQEIAPDGLDLDDIMAVGEYLRARLPATLQGVSSVVQLSAGYGLWRWKAGPRHLKARLWFINDIPLTGPDLRRWFRQQNAIGRYARMDEAVAGSTQPIYTGPPVFEGLADPVPVRLALLLSDADHTAIRPPAPPIQPPAPTGRMARDPSALARCVRLIETARPGEKHAQLNKASFLAGGFVAGGVVTEREARETLQAAIACKQGVADLDAAFATIERGLADGQRLPVPALPVPTPPASDPDLSNPPDFPTPPLSAYADADDSAPPADPDNPAATAAATAALSGRYAADLAGLQTLDPSQALSAACGFLNRHGWRCPWQVSYARLETDLLSAVCLNKRRRRALHRKIVVLERSARRRAREDTELDPAELRAAGVELIEVSDIADALADVQAHPDALNLIKAALGAGKTEGVLKPLADAEPGTAVAITHRVSLVADLCHRLRLGNYQTLSGHDIETTTGLGVCLKSILNPKFADPLSRARAVLIDEIAACVRECHDPRGVLGKAAQATWERLCGLLRAGTACGVDADLCTCDVLALRDAMAGRPVRVIVVTRPATEGMTAEIGDLDAIWARILAAVESGQPCRIFSDSAGQVRKLDTLLRRLYPDKRILAVHGAPGVATTGRPEVQAALRDINAAAPKLDVLLHSPAVESGVSLTISHFARTFGLYCGQVTPAGFVQMARRDRTAQHFEIGIAGTGARFAETHAGQLLANLDAVHRRTIEIAAHEGRFALKFEPATPWDGRVVAYRAARNQATNGYAQGAWFAFEALGATVTPLDAADEPFDRATQNMATDLARLEYQNMLTEAPDISAAEREAIQRGYQPSPEDSAAAERYDMKEALAIHGEVDADALAAWNEGKLKDRLRRFEQLHSAAPLDGLATDAADAAAQTALAARSHRLSEAEAIKIAFEILGFDPRTGAGEISNSTALEAFENLRASPIRPALEYFGLLQFGAPPKYPVSWAEKFLSKLGLGLETSGRLGSRTDRERVYHIRREPAWDKRGQAMTAPGWDLMTAICRRRGVSVHPRPKSLLDTESGPAALGRAA